MYKNKGLKRSYVFAYINTLFGLMVPALLAFKAHWALSIVLILLTLCDLAALIVAHVFYTKDDNLFKVTGFFAILGFGVIDFVGVIMEIIFAANGQYSHYATFALVISTISFLLVALFYYLDLRKKSMKAQEEEEKRKAVEELLNGPTE